MAESGHNSCTSSEPHQLMEVTMDTNWKHQKTAITTDQKNRTDDEHLHELDKKHLDESNRSARPAQEESESGPENLGEGVGLRRKRE